MLGGIFVHVVCVGVCMYEYIYACMYMYVLQYMYIHDVVEAHAMVANFLSRYLSTSCGKEVRTFRPQRSS